MRGRCRRRARSYRSSARRKSSRREASSVASSTTVTAARVGPRRRSGRHGVMATGTSARADADGLSTYLPSPEPFASSARSRRFASRSTTVALLAGRSPADRSLRMAASSFPIASFTTRAPSMSPAARAPPIALESCVRRAARGLVGEPWETAPGPLETAPGPLETAPAGASGVEPSIVPPEFPERSGGRLPLDPPGSL
jgi:hypothetical protein